MHAAVVALQPFYGGALPRPALGRWRTFLRLARSDDEAAKDEAERLLEWVNGEIESHRADEHPDGNHAEIRTAGDLWKALNEGKTPAVVVSSISLGQTKDDTPSAKTNERGDDQAAIRLLSVFTDGLADERLNKAGSVLDDDKLTVDEKLWKIDVLMPIPPAVSAAKLGKVLGVSKTAFRIRRGISRIARDKRTMRLAGGTNNTVSAVNSMRVIGDLTTISPATGCR